MRDYYLTRSSRNQHPIKLVAELHPFQSGQVFKEMACVRLGYALILPRPRGLFQVQNEVNAGERYCINSLETFPAIRPRAEIQPQRLFLFSRRLPSGFSHLTSLSGNLIVLTKIPFEFHSSNCRIVTRTHSEHLPCSSNSKL
jgi:hypothetical protein